MNGSDSMLSVSYLNLDSSGIVLGSVADPDWIWIQTVQWIQEGKNDPCSQSFEG